MSDLGPGGGPIELSCPDDPDMLYPGMGRDRLYWRWSKERDCDKVFVERAWAYCCPPRKGMSSRCVEKPIVVPKSYTDHQWHSVWGETETKAKFLERLHREGGDERHAHFEELRRCAVALGLEGAHDAWTAAAQCFKPCQPGDPYFTKWSFNWMRKKLILTYASRLRATEGTRDTAIPMSGPLNYHCQKIVKAKPAGKGSITQDELRWVINHGEDEYLDANEVLSQIIPSLWRSMKRNPDGFLGKWANRLTSRAASKAGAEIVQDDKSNEAAATAEAEQELAAMLEQFNPGADESDNSKESDDETEQHSEAEQETGEAEGRQSVPAVQESYLRPRPIHRPRVPGATNDPVGSTGG